MPKRVVLNDKLRGNRGPKAQRERRRPIQFLIARKVNLDGVDERNVVHNFDRPFGGRWRTLELPTRCLTTPRRSRPSPQHLPRCELQVIQHDDSILIPPRRSAEVEHGATRRPARPRDEFTRVARSTEMLNQKGGIVAQRSSQCQSPRPAVVLQPGHRTDQCCETVLVCAVQMERGGGHHDRDVQHP